MRIPYKAAQLSHYGSGGYVDMDTSKGHNIMVVCDEPAILTLSWDDKANDDDDNFHGINQTLITHCKIMA
jgi:hypothetical protein